MNLHQNFKMVKNVAWTTMDVLFKKKQKKQSFHFKILMKVY